MSNRLGKVIHWTLALFVLAAFLLLMLVYRPPLGMLVFMAPVVVWWLYTLLWHWRELAGRDVLARIAAGWLGVLVVMHTGYGALAVMHARYSHSEPPKAIIVSVKPDLSFELGGDVVTSSASGDEICDPGRIWLSDCARTNVRALVAALEKATGGNHNKLIAVRSARGVSPYYLTGMNTRLDLAGYVNVAHYTRGRHSPCHVPAGVSGEAIPYVSACRRISVYGTWYSPRS
jgi:hypothetical protein